MHDWKWSSDPLRSMFLVLLAAAAARAQEPAPPAQQPPVTSAPADTPQSDQPQTPLPRESAIENPLGRAGAVSGSAFGGYGELTYNDASNGPGVVDLRRFVLYFGHDFTDRLRFYSEVEVEHAISSADDQGEIEIEQMAISLLALPQPLARDLRVIVGTIKVSGDLERVGD